MPQIEVTITNAITGERHAPCRIFLGDDFTQINLLHRTISKDVHPDCHVNFHWGENFILGMPYNMEQDEEKMPFDEWVAKWYPEIAGPEYSN